MPRALDYLGQEIPGRRVLEEFMTEAQPLVSLGECAVASCYLGAAYKQARLCEMHYDDWSREGRPQGRRLDAFIARGAQPANARVLSLRGLPELVRLELLWVISCLLREQVHARPGDMRPYVDLLGERGVASLVELDPVTIDPTGRAGHGRFARFAFDRARLGYATPEEERGHEAMWPAFPASDYYGPSAPSPGISRQRACPPPPWRGSGEGGSGGGSHVHHVSIVRVGAQLFPCSIATSTPQAFLVASHRLH